MKIQKRDRRTQHGTGAYPSQCVVSGFLEDTVTAVFLVPQDIHNHVLAEAKVLSGNLDFLGLERLRNKSHRLSCEEHLKNPLYDGRFLRYDLRLGVLAFPVAQQPLVLKAHFPIFKIFAEEWTAISMLAKTHGQPASPTRLGKEVMVFVYRLERQLATLKSCPLTAKFGGATGNYNAHHVAYPEFDWKAFGNRFVAEKLGLEREEYTTQISNYDNLSAVFDAMKRINTVMIDMNRDFWQYISMEYFKQKIKAGEVGSSAMPHKVNPIDFENAEGNLGMANAILEHLSSKLPVSRLQRDLTDSTVLRNVGVPFGHIVIAIQSSLKGLRKLLLNEKAIYADLDNCWSVVAEAIQTILRREAYPHPYEALKALTRTNQAITEESIKEFIETLNVSEDIKKELRVITPHNYTGI